MAQKKLPELVIIYVKFGTSLLCSWPVASKATNFQKKISQLKWWLLWLSAFALELPILYTAYLMRNNFMEFTKYICFGASVAHGIIKMVICRCYQREYQELIEQMEDYIKHATTRERQVLDICVRKAAPVHVTFNIIGFIAAISYICGPLILDQNLPTDAVYPFRIDYYPVYPIIYTMQSITALQCGAGGPLDAQVCMLLWFSIARLKLLAHDMRNIASVDDLNACIQVHQSILRFHKKTAAVARPMVITTVSMATLATVFGGIHIVGHEPLEVKAQFVGLDIGYGSLLYPSAWAAENLMKALDDVKWALYDSPWLHSSRKINQSIIIILQRLNTVPKISVGGLIPELSLNYYAAYLSKTMSFFTTLHIMLQKMEETV